MEEDISKWKDTPYLWIQALILLRYHYYPNQSIYLMQLLSTLMTFHRNKKKKTHSKIHMES